MVLFPFPVTDSCSTERMDTVRVSVAYRRASRSRPSSGSYKADITSHGQRRVDVGFQVLRGNAKGRDRRAARGGRVPLVTRAKWPRPSGRAPRLPAAPTPRGGVSSRSPSLSPGARDVGHRPPCLLAARVSPLEKRLSGSFAHFNRVVCVSSRVLRVLCVCRAAVFIGCAFCKYVLTRGSSHYPLTSRSPSLAC